MLKPIDGYEGLYSVTPDGRVWSHTRRYGNGNPLIKGQWLTPIVTRKGYYRLKLCKNGKSKSFQVSRLVAQAYIPNSKNKPQVNHLSGVKADNRVQNLEFVTNLENMQHARKNGFYDNVNFNGENNPASKLSWDNIYEIRNNHKYRKRGDKTWEKYGISNVQYYRILNNECWKE